MRSHYHCSHSLIGFKHGAVLQAVPGTNQVERCSCACWLFHLEKVLTFLVFDALDVFSFLNEGGLEVHGFKLSVGGNAFLNLRSTNLLDFFFVFSSLHHKF